MLPIPIANAGPASAASGCGNATTVKRATKSPAINDSEVSATEAAACRDRRDGAGQPRCRRSTAPQKTCRRGRYGATRAAHSIGGFSIVNCAKMPPVCELAAGCHVRYTFHFVVEGKSREKEKRMTSEIEDADLKERAAVYVKGATPSVDPTHTTLMEALVWVKTLPKSEQRLIQVKIRHKPPLLYEDFKNYIA